MPEITVRYPHNWLATNTIKANEQGVTTHFRNLVSSSTMSYRYSLLRPEACYWEGGDKSWNALALGFLVVSFVVGRFLDYLPVAWHASLVALALAALCFGLRLRIRRWVTFRDTTGEVAFTIPLTGADEIVEYIVERLAVAHPEMETEIAPTAT